MDIAFAFRFPIEIGYNSFAKHRRRHMTSEAIQEGFDVFVHDGEKAFGAVRKVGPHNITVYIENAGDFVVPREAVKDVYSEKVILNPSKLDTRLKEAIKRAHSGEDPRIL
jgi:hypothetical protein